MKTSKQTALIIDDDSIFANMLSDILKSKVKEVHSSTNSIEGRKKITELKPDIIFLDNWLPGLNGSDLIEEFKQLSPDSYIVMVSSFVDVKEIALCIQKGANDFLSKDIFSEVEVNKILKNQQDNTPTFDWSMFVPSLFKPLPKITKNIAIIEDDEIFSFHMKWILNTAEENLVNSFSTGDEFFKFHKEIAPDIIFLDYFLPDGNGDKILDKIKELMPKSKVVLISSQDNTEIAIELKRKGVDNYISKDKNWRNNLNDVLGELSA